MYIYIYIYIYIFFFFLVDSKVFIPDIRVVHLRDLNFVLKFEIFVHWDEQLQASHLILGVEPIYSTWQPFRQALLVNSPLLSYIDVRHAHFLPPKLTVGEAWELGWRYTCLDELAPLRDESAERVSRRLRELAHAPVEEEAPVQEEPAQPKEPGEPKAPTQVIEQVTVDITNLSDTKSDRSGDMVTRKTMTIDRFVPDARQIGQQQPSQGQGQTPPPSPPPQTGRTRKRQHVAKQNSTDLGDVVTQITPQPSRGIVIQELQTQVGEGVASFSQAVQARQPKFQLDGKPLPVSTSVRV